MPANIDHPDLDLILASVQSPILRSAVLYWANKRNGRTMPSRQDIEPLELRHALGYISLVDIERNPYRFFFRLDGSKQVELFQVDCTNRYLDECFDAQHLSIAVKSYQLVAETGKPSYYQRQLSYHERIISYEIVILPLGEAATLTTPPNMLMTVIVPNW